MKPMGTLEPTPAIPDAIDESRLWTVDDVCRFLGVSRRWVHERTRLRTIPCFRWGHLLRFSPQEVAAWAAKHHHSPETNGSSGRAR